MTEASKVPGTEHEYRIVATVTSVSKSTTGYGDNEKIVGVEVDSSYVFELDGEAVTRKLNFTLPLALRRFALPGDKITLIVGQTGEVGWPS